MRISDWSSDVCSSDLRCRLLWLHIERATAADKPRSPLRSAYPIGADLPDQLLQNFGAPILVPEGNLDFRISMQLSITANSNSRQMTGDLRDRFNRSEEHTSELQSLMRISYAVFCLKKKTHI